MKVKQIQSLFNSEQGFGEPFIFRGDRTGSSLRIKSTAKRDRRWSRLGEALVLVESKLQISAGNTSTGINLTTDAVRIKLRT